MGEHSARWHEVLFRDVSIALIQMDELYAKVRGVEEARWLWLAIDPKSKALLALHLGLRRSEDAYILVHKLKKCLHSDCVPAFTTDGLRSYFYAVTAHFGNWFRPPRARKDHWQVDERLLQGQLVKRHERRKLTYTITRMLWGKRKALNDLLEQQGFRQLIQTAYTVSTNYP
jgi:IS1 family transposase